MKTNYLLERGKEQLLNKIGKTIKAYMEASALDKDNQQQQMSQLKIKSNKKPGRYITPDKEYSNSANSNSKLRN